MTNATMFVYAYGIIMKQGTACAWNKMYELSKENEHLKKWFQSPYVQTANHDMELIKEFDKVGL